MWSSSCLLCNCCVTAKLRKLTCFCRSRPRFGTLYPRNRFAHTRQVQCSWMPEMLAFHIFYSKWTLFSFGDSRKRLSTDKPDIGRTQISNTCHSSRQTDTTSCQMSTKPADVDYIISFQINQIERLLMTSSRNRKSGKTTLLSDYLNNGLTENALVGFE